jgi:hypothetical protein
MLNNLVSYYSLQVISLPLIDEKEEITEKHYAFGGLPVNVAM